MELRKLSLTIMIMGNCCYALATVFVAMRTPKFLQEFTLNTGGAGGSMPVAKDEAALEIRPAPVDDEDEDGEKLYAAYGITWDTDVSGFKSADFPTFKDLYALLLKRLETSEDKKNLEYLTVIIRELAEGSDRITFSTRSADTPCSSPDQSGC